MQEVTIDGSTYRIGKLNAKAQWNVVRRMGPVFAAAGPAIKMWVKTATEDVKEGESVNIDELFDAAGPLAIALGELTDEANDYVIGRCLSVCQMNRGATWASVATPHGDIMFDTITMPTMLRLVLYVLQENLSDFFSALGGSSPAPQA